MTAMCVMVLGTTSGAGKSWLATALCRRYARQGLDVVPFKAQNMSNNARVVEGLEPGTFGEIGSAQYFQALAAGVTPEVRMNPLLLKPESDTASQVVMLGQVDDTLGAMPWRDRSDHVWPTIAQALDELRAEHDVVVMEGAGSPAEVNLQATDIANLRPAMHARARCLLVTDIDRGGAFAHLYGTWALMPEPSRALIRGFVLNKFRGDPTLLAPAPQMLQDHTGIPTVATLPLWWDHGLPEEDGVFDDRSRVTGVASKTVAVVVYPRISNLDEFQLLGQLPGVKLIWARGAAELAEADLIVLPGSKNTVSDLEWLRARGLDQVIRTHAMAGGAVLGICGGLQMLGRQLVGGEGERPSGDSRVGITQGLGLLPLRTTFEPHTDKIVTHTTGTFATLTGVWSGLAGVELTGYEIHLGRTETLDPLLPGPVWQVGSVLGIAVHGLFEDARTLRALFGVDVPELDSVFDGLADFVDEHFEVGVLDRLIDP